MANFYGSLIGFGAGGAGFVGMVASGGNQPLSGGTVVDTDYKVHTFTEDGDL